MTNISRLYQTFSILYQSFTSGTPNPSIKTPTGTKKMNQVDLNTLIKGFIA